SLPVDWTCSLIARKAACSSCHQFCHSDRSGIAGPATGAVTGTCATFPAAVAPSAPVGATPAPGPAYCPPWAASGDASATSASEPERSPAVIDEGGIERVAAAERKLRATTAPSRPRGTEGSGAGPGAGAASASDHARSGNALGPRRSLLAAAAQ